MKDLATLRNPGSPYTFLSYLHSEGRLLSFINRGGTVPTRKEYSDYLTWASKKVQDNGINVKFGHEIIDLDEGPEDTILVRYRNNRTGEETRVAGDLVISPGGLPKIPDNLLPFQNHPRVRHSSGYATSIGAIFDSLASVKRPLRVAVVGSGQSAAEVTMDLRNRLCSIPVPGEGRHIVEMLIRKGSLKPSDDSPFANEIFDPAATDACYNAPSKRRRDAVLAEYRATNYGVVNPVTLEALYEIIYDQRLNAQVARRTQTPEPSEPIINIRPYTSISDVKLLGEGGSTSAADLLLAPTTSTDGSGGETFQLTLRNLATAAVTEENYDVIIYATGYQRQAWVNLLKHTGIGKHFGLSPATRKVNLRPTTDLTAADEYTVPSSPLESVSPAFSSTQTTPPTSPEASMFSSVQFEAELNPDLFLTRQYRLLPKASRETGRSLVPRIYLQGVEEATHGLSDTLLSVLGIRAGEVLADLSNRK